MSVFPAAVLPILVLLDCQSGDSVGLSKDSTVLQGRLRADASISVRGAVCVGNGDVCAVERAPSRLGVPARELLILCVLPRAVLGEKEAACCCFASALASTVTAPWLVCGERVAPDAVVYDESKTPDPVASVETAVSDALVCCCARADLSCATLWVSSGVFRPSAELTATPFWGLIVAIAFFLLGAEASDHVTTFRHFER